MDGVKLVSSTLLGVDCENIIVGGKVYVLFPPTIKKIAGAGYYLSNLGEGKTATEVLSSMKDMGSAVKALSWLIQGDLGLVEELSEGTLAEVVEGLQKAIELIGIGNFIKLSGLVRNVRSLIATTR